MTQISSIVAARRGSSSLTSMPLCPCLRNANEEGSSPPVTRSVDLRTERVTGGLLPSSFAFRKHGQSGIEVSELLPRLAATIDDICVIRSMYTFNPTHNPARFLFYTGSI